MSIGFDDFNNKTVIKVVGVGGGGIKAVNSMITAGVKGFEFISVDYDISKSLAFSHVKLGWEETSSVVINTDPDSSARDANERSEEILHVLRGANMVFIIVGMGGGTGTGAAPIVAKCAKQIGALTVGVVAYPHLCEGDKTYECARRGIMDLYRVADTIITIPNEKVFGNLDKSASITDALKEVDDIICQGVQSICDLVSDLGYVNVDFIDIETILNNEHCFASIGVGESVGSNAPLVALREAINSPIMEAPLYDSRGIIINFMGEASHLNMMELNEAAQSIVEEVHPEANILWGVSVDDNMGDTIRTVVLATSPRKQYP